MKSRQTTNEQELQLASDLTKALDTVHLQSYEEIAVKVRLKKGPLLYAAMKALKDSNVVYEFLEHSHKMFVMQPNMKSVPISTQEVWVLGALRGDL